MLGGRYTLLDQSASGGASPALSRAQDQHHPAGFYNSGILATGSRGPGYYNYEPARPEILEKTQRVEAVSARRRVPLKPATARLRRFAWLNLDGAPVPALPVGCAVSGLSEAQPP